MRLQSLAETRSWIFAIAAQCERPCVVLLDGDLGAGKTQTVRFFLEALGLKGAASPTFAIHHEYPSKAGPIDHVDLYRVKSDADLEATGFWDLFSRDDGFVFIEWASRLPEDIWPAHWQRVFIQLRTVAGQDEARDVTLRIRPPSPR